MSISQEVGIQIPDLQSLLRQCLDSHQLQVLDYSSTKLLPLGENYSCLLSNLKVTIRKTKTSPPIILNLVSKTRNHLNTATLHWPKALKKEVFMYSDILPAYKSLLQCLGISSGFDIAPEYIGHRFSLSGIGDAVDEHSCLLLQNLRAKGYYHCDRLSGMDVPHAKSALSSLAEYHSLSLALKQKSPAYFATVIARARESVIPSSSLFRNMAVIRTIVRDAVRPSKHMPVIEASFDAVGSGGRLGSEAWLGIPHGDFWINNIMFHRNEHSNVDDVKLVDFQFYKYASLLGDIPYFVCGSLGEDTVMRAIDELFGHYHDQLIRSLERLGCDTESYTKEAFDRELKLEAIGELPICALALKFIFFQIDRDRCELNHDYIIQAKPSDGYVKALKRLVWIYEKKGWL